MGRHPVHLTGAVVLAALALTASPAASAPDRLSVGLNQTLRVPLGGSAASVVVGKAEIADVTMVDAHSAIVVGKSLGTSEIMVLDSSGRTLLDSLVTVSPHPAARSDPADPEVTIFRGAVAENYACTLRCEAEKPRSGSPERSGGQTSEQ
jgi:Flp pilus assembly secretin CpaC